MFGATPPPFTPTGHAFLKILRRFVFHACAAPHENGGLPSVLVLDSRAHEKPNFARRLGEHVPVSTLFLCVGVAICFRVCVVTHVWWVVAILSSL